MRRKDKPTTTIEQGEVKPNIASAATKTAAWFPCSGGRQAKCTGLALLVWLLFLMSACGNRSTGARAPMISYTSTTTGDVQARLFSIPPEQRGHVQIVAVETMRLPRVLRVPGAVTYNNFETTPVITQSSGPISRILISPGQVVSAGQPLLYVSSPDFAQLRSNYLKARDAFTLAEKNYKRAEDLYTHHAIAQADLLQAESNRNQTQADLQAAEQALRVLGVQPDRAASDPASPEIPLLAPIEGEVVERLVSPGQVIQAGTTQCFTISNMKTVWVLVNVYEHDLGSVRIGDRVDIQTDAYTDVFHGRISYIAPALDPSTRTLLVRIVTDNPGKKLKKDMYVTAIVHAGGIDRALTVPDSAVLRNAENQPFVYVATGANEFGERLVTIGASVNGKTHILSGLQTGEQVVADGSLFLQFANAYQR
jgi:cobalt-zinc-cadmium efflux system membrane fusion protein